MNTSWLKLLREQRERNSSYLQCSTLIIPLVIFAWLAWRNRWIVDDGYIFLRVVDQITSGNGPVFNAGERVEAFSSTLWQALLVFSDLAIPVRLEWLAVLLGIVMSVSGLAMAMAGAASLARMHQPKALLLPFGVLLPLGVFIAWRFATSGMETGLVLGWLGACLYLLAHWATHTRRLSLPTAMLIGLGWLVRPELALFSGLFIITVLSLQWRQDGWRNRLLTLFAAGVVPVSYQIFRMGYYGTLVPNPALTKDASEIHWAEGWLYLLDFVNPYWLWLALLILCFGGYLPLIWGLWQQRARRALAVVCVFVIAGLLHATYIVAIGGDWLHGRLLLPAFYALALPVAVIPLSRAHSLALLIIPWAMACALWLRPPQLHTPSLMNPINAPSHNAVLIEKRGWGDQSMRERRLRQAGGFHADAVLGMRFQVIESAASGPYVRLPGLSARVLGLPSYALGPEWHVIDTFGLAHHIGSRFEVTPSLRIFPRKTGHKKALPTVWLAAMITPEGSRPDPAEFPGVSNPLIRDTSGDEFQRQVDTVRMVLKCPALNELHAAVTEPLDWQRFMTNFTGAWARTRLTIPPDPDLAWQKFCL